MNHGRRSLDITRSVSYTHLHLYLWDEPLNYLDMISRIQLEALMIHHGPTIVFIEHDAAFCDAVATKELVL